MHPIYSSRSLRVAQQVTGWASRVATVALLWLGLLCIIANGALAGTLTAELMDVGQGDSILITTPAGKRILIDAGVRRANVVDKLRQRGVEQLDLVVATHSHADHIGGLADVLNSFPVRVFIDSGIPHTTQTYLNLMKAVDAQDIPYRPAQVGQTFRLDDGIVIDVLFPAGVRLAGTRSDINSNSVVLRLTHGDNCMLFTGDSEDPTERALLSAGIKPCEVLKVAHHGSGHSSSAAWLRAVQPEVALISCGVNNRYGHPDPQALQRLQSAGAVVYRTDTMGDIVVTSDGKEISVQTSGKRPASPAQVSRAPSEAVTAPAPEDRTGRGSSTSATGVQAAVLPATRQHQAFASGKDGKTGRRSVVASRGASNASGSAALGPSAGPSAGPGAGLGLGEPGCVFVSSRNSGLYHPASCGIVQRIWVGNRVCWADAAAAEQAGKTRSQACPDGTP